MCEVEKINTTMIMLFTSGMTGQTCVKHKHDITKHIILNAYETCSQETFGHQFKSLDPVKRRAVKKNKQLPKKWVLDNR